MFKRTMVTATMVVAGAAIAVLLGWPSGAVSQLGDGFKDEPNRPHVMALTDQQEKELLSSLKEKNPDDYERLTRLKEENPREYHWALHAAWRTYQITRDMSPDMQKIFEQQRRAKLKAWRLSRDCLQAKDPNQKDKVMTDLRSALRQEFDSEQQLREMKLNQLEDQIKHLRGELKERAGQRDKVIEDNLNRLLKGEGASGTAAASGSASGTHAATRPAD